MLGRLGLGVAGLFLASVLSAAWAIAVAMNPPGPPGTDGAGYVFLGAVELALIFAVAA